LLGVGDATIHDLRRTFATVHGELGTPPEILKSLLNHTPRDITERVYNRATNLEPRRRAMAIWVDWLEQVLRGESMADNVIRFRR
jgi:integrase